jgi:hypothetical protein
VVARFEEDLGCVFEETDSPFGDLIDGDLAIIGGRLDNRFLISALAAFRQIQPWHRRHLQVSIQCGVATREMSGAQFVRRAGVPQG